MALRQQNILNIEMVRNKVKGVLIFFPIYLILCHIFWGGWGLGFGFFSPVACLVCVSMCITEMFE